MEWAPLWWEVCAFPRAHPRCNLPLPKFWKNIQTEASGIIHPKFVPNSQWEEEQQKETCSGTNNITMELTLHCQISCPGRAPFAAFAFTKLPKAEDLLLLPRKFILFLVSLCKNNVKQQKKGCQPPPLGSPASPCRTQSSKGGPASLHGTTPILRSLMGNLPIRFNRTEIIES